MNCGRCGSTNTTTKEAPALGYDSAGGTNIVAQCHDCQRSSRAFRPSMADRAKSKLRSSAATRVRQGIIDWIELRYALPPQPVPPPPLRFQCGCGHPVQELADTFPQYHVCHGCETAWLLPTSKGGAERLRFRGCPIGYSNPRAICGMGHNRAWSCSPHHCNGMPPQLESDESLRERLLSLNLYPNVNVTPRVASASGRELDLLAHHYGMRRSKA